MLAHQYLGQLDQPLREAVVGNVGTIITFALGWEDAVVVAGQLHNELTTADLVHLPHYHAYVALCIGGRTGDPFLMQTDKPPESYLSDTKFSTLVDLSRERYTQPARRVQEQLQKALAYH